MKPQLFAIFTLATFTTATLPTQAQDIEARETSAPTKVFMCDQTQETPRTIIMGLVGSDDPEPIPMIDWSAQYFESASEALSLCEEVSQELQMLYESGKLTRLSLVAGTLEGESVACLEEEMGEGCQRDRVLFPLETERPAEEVLGELIAADFQPPRTRGDFPTRLNFNILKLLRP